MKSFALAALAATASAYSNSVPIYGTYPGWVKGGNRTGIELSFFEDMLCSGCENQNDIFNQVLDTAWLDGTVRDQVLVKTTPIVLPYHVHSFQVTQVVPLLMDMCTDDASKCDLLDQYLDYTLTNHSSILSQDISINAFEASWPDQVEAAIGVDAYSVSQIYTSHDVHNTNSRVREMWKYAVSRGVNWTPSVFINGVKLDSNPNSVDQWINHLNTVYNSQYSHNHVQEVRPTEFTQ